MSDTKKTFTEDDGTDPLTLTNLILAHDARQEGFNWISAANGGQRKSFHVIGMEGRQQASLVGDYNKNPSQGAHQQPVLEAGQEQQTQPQQGQDPGQNQQQQQQPVEANSQNPQIFSSEPQFNPCPAFLMGACRVDGRPCPYSYMDYKECGKFYLASSGDPELFEISPGREQSLEYQLGIKS